MLLIKLKWGASPKNQLTFSSTGWFISLERDKQNAQSLFRMVPERGNMTLNQRKKCVPTPLSRGRIPRQQWTLSANTLSKGWSNSKYPTSSTTSPLSWPPRAEKWTPSTSHFCMFPSKGRICSCSQWNQSACALSCPTTLRLRGCSLFTRVRQTKSMRLKWTRPLRMVFSISFKRGLRSKQWTRTRGRRKLTRLTF